MEELNLNELKLEACVKLKDSTVYKIIGIENISAVNLKDSTFARWISKDDIEAIPENLLDEYFWDEPSGFLFVECVCGKSALQIDGSNYPVEIISRFENLSYKELANAVCSDEKAVKEYKAMASEKYFKTGLYDMPILYEIYVRMLMRKRYKNLIPWEIDSGECRVCDKAFLKFFETNGGEKIINNADAYLEGKLVPDIVLKNNENNEYIIFDVKYKKGTYNSGTRSDRFQILAYAYMWNCKKIGHIFPEKKSDKSLVIELANQGRLSYREFSVVEGDDVCEIIKYL